MTKSNAPLPSDRSNPENIAPEDSLILKDPLLVASPLGINRQFLVPLGARSLTILDPHIFQQQSAHSEASLFQDSPFFDDRSSAEPGSKQTTQPVSTAGNKPVPAHSLPELASFDEKPTLQGKLTAQKPELQSSDESVQRSPEVLSSTAAIVQRDSRSIPQPSTAAQTEGSTSLLTQNDGYAMPSSKVAVSEIGIPQTQTFHQQALPVLTDTIAPLSDHSTPSSNQTTHESLPIQTVEKRALDALPVQRSLVSDEASNYALPSIQSSIQLNQAAVSPSLTQTELIPTQAYPASLAKESEVAVKTSQFTPERVTSIASTPIIQPAPLVPTQTTHLAGATTQTIDTLGLESTPDQTIQSSAEVQPEVLLRPVALPADVSQSTSVPTQIELSPQRLQAATTPQPVISTSLDQPLQRQNVNPLEATQAYQLDDSEVAQTVSQVVSKTDSQAATTPTISRSNTNTTDVDFTSIPNTQSSTLPPHGLEDTDISFSKHSNDSNTDRAFEPVVTKASSPSLQNSFNSLVLDQPSEQPTAPPSIQASATSLPIEHSSKTTAGLLASQEHHDEHDYKPILPDPLTQLKPQQAAVESSDAIAKMPASPQLIQQESPVKAIMSQATQWLSKAVTLFAGTEANNGEEKTSDHSLAPLQQANSEDQVDQPVDSFQHPSSHNDLEVALAPSGELKSPQQAGETTELQLKADLPLVPNVATEANASKLDASTIKNADSSSAVVAEIALEGIVQPLINTIDIPKADVPEAEVPKSGAAKTEVAQLSLSKESIIPLVSETFPEVELQRVSEPFSKAISEKIDFIDHSIQPTDTADLKQPSSDSKPLEIATAIDQIVPKATLQRTSESSQLESIDLITSYSGERLAKSNNPSLETEINAEETASIGLEEISVSNGSEANSELMSGHAALSSEAIAAKATANVSHTASETGLATNLETNSGTSTKVGLDASSISDHTVSTTEIGLQRAYQTSEAILFNRSETALKAAPNPSAEINLDQPDVTDHVSPTELELQKAAQFSYPSENTSNQSDRWQEPTLQPHLEATAQSTLETQLNSINSVSNVDSLASTVARSIEQPLKEDTFTTAAIDSASLEPLQLTSASVDETPKLPVVDTDSATTAALTTAEVPQPHTNEHTNEQETLLLNARHSAPLHSSTETLQAPNNVFDAPSLQLDANAAALSVQAALTTNTEATPEALVEQKQQAPILLPVSVDAQTEVAIQAAPNLFDQVLQSQTAEAVTQALPETANEQLPLLAAEPHHSTSEATIVQRDITNYNVAESANHLSSQSLQLNSSEPSDLPEPSDLANESVVIQADLITETPFFQPEKSSTTEFLSAKAEVIPSEGLAHDPSLVEQPDRSSSNTIQALSASSPVNQTVQATSEIARSTSGIEDSYSASKSEITPSTLFKPNELIQASTASPEVLTEALRQPTSLAEAIVQPFSSLSNQASVSEPLTSMAQATSNIERTHLFSSSTEAVQSDIAQNFKPEPLLGERSPSETEYIQAKTEPAAPTQHLATQHLEALPLTDLSSSEPPSLATLPTVEALFSSETLPLASPDLAPPTVTQPINSVQTDATLQLKSMQATATQSTEAVAADWQQPQESSTKPLAVETTNQTIAETTIAQPPNRSIIQPATATAQEAASIETVLAQAAVSLQTDAALSASPSHAAQRKVQPPSLEAALKVEDANVIAPQAELLLVTQSLPELSTSEQVQLRTAPAPEVTTDPVETSEMTAQLAKSDVTVSQPEMPILQASALPLIETSEVMPQSADRAVATQTTLPTLQAAAETSAVLLVENAALENTEKQQVTENIEPVTSAKNAILQRLPNDAPVEQSIALSTEGIEPTALETVAIIQRLPIDNAPVEQSIALSTEEIEPAALETTAIVQRLPNDAPVEPPIAFSTEGIEPTALEPTAIVQRLPNDVPVNQAIALPTSIEPTALETAIVQRIPNDAPVEPPIAFSTEGIERTALEPTAIVQRLPNDASVEQAIAPSELASVTALRQPETAPQLPLVLQTLTTLQPLSDRLNHASAVQTSIVQASTANTLHRSPTQVATTSPAQPPIDQQKVVVNRATSQWSDFSNLVQGQTKPSPRSGRSGARDGSTMDSTGAGSLIQAKLSEGTEVIRLSRTAQPGIAETAEADVVASADYLETLAQEIYQRLRQRMRVEQERQGRDYAGRLPW